MEMLTIFLAMSSVDPIRYSGAFSGAKEATIKSKEISSIIKPATSYLKSKLPYVSYTAPLLYGALYRKQLSTQYTIKWLVDDIIYSADIKNNSHLVRFVVYFK